MIFPRLFFLSLGLPIAVYADLTCLQWGLLFTPIALLCHFKHSTFNAVENATIGAVEAFATDVEHAADFAVKHHPIVLAYNYVDILLTNGSTAANSNLRGQLHDDVEVSVGFGKELANTAVNIYELAHWNDLAICLVQSALLAKRQSTSRQGPADDVDVSESAKPILPTSYRTHTDVIPVKSKRAGALSASQAGLILDKCASQKFHQVAQPAVFNITEPNEKVGSTLAKLASFFVPVGPEAKGAEVALNGVDLAIPGSEDVGRIYQKLGEESQHFEGEAEALAVKERLKDPDWVHKNCNSCRAPEGTTMSRLHRRGVAMSLCCVLPDTIPDAEIRLDEMVEQEPVGKALPYHEPQGYRAWIPETELSPPPNLRIWQDANDDASNILHDLAVHQTAVIAWSPETKQAFSSKDFFKLLRRAFNPETKADHDLAQRLKIVKDRRFTINSNSWIDTTTQNPDLQRLQQFTRAAIQQLKDDLKVLKGLDQDAVDQYATDMDIYWIPATKAAINNPDLRGLHVDNNVLQYGMADQPGLIVQNGNSLSRLPVFDDAWHMLKCSRWDIGHYRPDLATRHTVFGPEIVQNGRVSIIVNIGGLAAST